MMPAAVIILGMVGYFTGVIQAPRGSVCLQPIYLAMAQGFMAKPAEAPVGVKAAAPPS